MPMEFAVISVNHLLVDLMVSYANIFWQCQTYSFLPTDSISQLLIKLSYMLVNMLPELFGKAQLCQ